MLGDKMNKILWKTIENYEDYEISSSGIIRRIRYDNPGNNTQYKIPYYIKYNIDKDGYLRCALSKKGKTKSYFVHRLVIQAFKKNLENKPCVNHIDGNKENNDISNLEYVTVRENNLHALKLGLRDMKNNKLSKEVFQYDLEGNLINKYKSSADAGRKNNFNSSHVRDCCRGRLKTYKGFIWKYNCN